MSATEALVLRMRKQRDIAIALGIGAVVAVLAAQAVAHSRGLYCMLHNMAPYRPPPAAPCLSIVPAIPDYAPTGDDAEAKYAGAVGVGVENALWVADWFDDALDRDIAALEARRARE